MPLYYERITESQQGYDTGIISAVLVYIGTSLNHKELTSGEKELITSITSGAAFFGAIFAGLTADKYGRKIAVSILFERPISPRTQGITDSKTRSTLAPRSSSLVQFCKLHRLRLPR